MKLPTSFAICAFLFCLLFTLPVSAQFSSNDYLVADTGGNQIAVYDQNFNFIRYLDASFNQVSGLTVVSPGVVAAAGRTPGTIRLYNSSGATIQNFSAPNVGIVRDLKSYMGNRLFAGSRSTVTAVAQYSTTGTPLPSVGAKAYTGVAVLSGDVLWASEATGNTIDVFDLLTGTLTSTITLDSGQVGVGSMYYNPSTDTVFLTDFDSSSIYERTTAGVLVRQYTGGNAGLGVTVGAGGVVAATVGTTVHQWTSAGDYIGSVDISANVSNAGNILAVGVFAPTAAPVSISGQVVDAGSRGVSRATVSAILSDGTRLTAITSPFGYFSIGGITAGQSVVVDVRHRTLTFASQVVNATDNVVDLIITANRGSLGPIEKGSR